MKQTNEIRFKRTPWVFSKGYCRDVFLVPSYLFRRNPWKIWRKKRTWILRQIHEMLISKNSASKLCFARFFICENFFFHFLQMLKQVMYKLGVKVVNFTYILWALFSYESTHSYLFTWSSGFWRKKIGGKADCKMLVKLTTGVKAIVRIVFKTKVHYTQCRKSTAIYLQIETSSFS